MSIRILLLIPLLLGLSVNGWAAHCTVTISASTSIQTTIDAATFGDVVCLDGIDKLTIQPKQI